ncbi:MAG: hypothetical protein JNJ54_31195 [Myxococcaceae bacterium]|nr:hypothetical protein [Myxococcaceae bacterium]
MTHRAQNHGATASALLVIGPRKDLERVAVRYAQVAVAESFTEALGLNQDFGVVVVSDVIQFSPVELRKFSQRGSSVRFASDVLAELAGVAANAASPRTRASAWPGESDDREFEAGSSALLKRRDQLARELETTPDAAKQAELADVDEELGARAALSWQS